MITFYVLIVSAVIICGILLYTWSIKRLMHKKNEEFRIKEAAMLKQVQEQAKKIDVLKSLVDGQDKILAMYRDKKK